MQYFVPKPGASQSTHRNDDMHSHTDTLSGSYKRGVEVGREAVKDITNITHGFSRAVDSLWKHKQAPQDGSRQRSDFAGSEDNILALSHPDQQQRINACYFVIGTFIEVWLCQNDRLSFASPTKAGPSSLSGYIKPTEAQIGAVSLLVGYVVPSHPREYKGDQRFMDGKLTSNAFSVMQPKLYWFLKLAIEYWPKEDTFASVIDIWLTFITPWRKDSKDAKFSTEWLAYVQDNFMFYTCLLDTFLRRTRNFDIYGSVRPIQTEHAASKTYNNSHLVMTEKVLEAFDDPLLVSVLSSIESALFAFDSQGNRLGATRARRGTSSEQAASAGWNSDSLMLQRLGSTGDESRLKLQSLGEKIGRPVFVLRRAYEGQAQRQSTSSITDLVGLVGNSAGLLIGFSLRAVILRLVCSGTICKEAESGSRISWMLDAILMHLRRTCHPHLAEVYRRHLSLNWDRAGHHLQRGRRCASLFGLVR
ncbi:hypothetical protein BC832DRAFT_103208 [Gaertneriomyces semiglobifer]|nr:hypothetical protein BC832DRAFT_103208 [Gaertneriomyces semiglobifer]